MIAIGFIRHGNTEWNALGRMQGQTDVPLSPAGREQAARLARRLASERWDGIWSSDLSRAAETAGILSRISGIPYRGSDPRLRERSFGRLEGTTLAERIEAWGEHWRELEHGKESLEGLLARWDGFLQDVFGAARGQRMLIVSHGGYIEPVLAHRYAAVPDQHLDNASLTVVESDSPNWRCSLMNCTQHLAEPASEVEQWNAKD